MDNIIVAGEDCEKCFYGTIDNSNKSKIVVNCSYKNKKYIWGQYVPCDDKKNK